MMTQPRPYLLHMLTIAWLSLHLHVRYAYHLRMRGTSSPSAEARKPPMMISYTDDCNTVVGHSNLILRTVPSKVADYPALGSGVGLGSLAGRLRVSR